MYIQEHLEDEFLLIAMTIEEFHYIQQIIRETMGAIKPIDRDNLLLELDNDAMDMNKEIEGNKSRGKINA